MSELFSFEVPTKSGEKFRIVGPDHLPASEIEAIGDRIAALLKLLVLDDGTDPEEVFVGSDRPAGSDDE